VIHGSARVSTDGQSVDAQVRQFTRAGCKKMFREVIKRRDKGEPLHEIAESYNISHSTISRLAA
jgi:DNA invertase Pin-like site-specific DNA recombinase